MTTPAAASAQETAASWQPLSGSHSELASLETNQLCLNRRQVQSRSVPESVCLSPQLGHPPHFQQLQQHQLREVPELSAARLPDGQTRLPGPGDSSSVWQRLPGARRAVRLRLPEGETAENTRST